MKIAKNNAKNCVPSMPRPELLQLSERIKLVIEILKVEKKLFAQAGGITAQSLSGYLAAIREPGATCLEGWIRSFNINGHWLLTGEGNMLLSQDQPEISSIPKEEFDEHLSQAQREMLTFRRIMTQNNLGNALQSLGCREADTQHLEDAVFAFRAALLERTQARVPLGWAGTQHNLGNALQLLGERETGTQRLEEAIAAYHAALLERTRERVPLDWAMIDWGRGLVSARIVDTRGLNQPTGIDEVSGHLSVHNQAQRVQGRHKGDLIRRFKAKVLHEQHPIRQE